MREPLTDRYLEAKRIAMAAVDLVADEREAFLSDELHADSALEKEVRWMLDAMERSEVQASPLLSMPTIDLSGRDAEAAVPSHYRVLRRLGEGGMGVVYLAERDNGGYVQPVALKMLCARAEGSPILLERFARERQLLARLEHPGIARLLDGGMLSNGKPFLAMEFVDGERIDAWCDRQKLDLRARLRLFLKVCDAVAYAHRSLVIHRDIKPANILVTSAGDPKLLDFGIARLMDDEPREALTETGQHAMSLSYASPEQIACKALTTTTDVYSLGAVLYRLVSGSTPFAPTTTPVALMNAILSGDVQPPGRRADTSAASRRSRVPADIDAIVLKALRKEPADRYESVGALVVDLKRHLDDRPVAARRGQRLYYLGRFARRHRWPLLAVAMVMAIGAAFLFDRTRYLHQVEAERNRAQALSGFMTQLFASAAPSEKESNKVTLREVLDKGVASLLKRTDIGPAIKGKLLYTMGETYLSLHLIEPANVPLQQARKLLDQAQAPLVDRVNVIQKLALAASMSGENARGIALSREGQQLLAAQKDRHLHLWLELRWLELDNQSSQGEVASQVLKPKLRELIAAIQKDTDAKSQELLGEAYKTLSSLQERDGKLDEALASMRIALRAGDKDGNRPEDRLTMRSNYVRMLIAHGDLAEGVAQSKALDRDYVRVIGPDTMQRASLLNNMSVALGSLDRKKEALAAGEQAVEIARRSGGADNRFYLQLAVGQVMRLIDASQYAEAKTLLREVLPRLKSTAGKGMGDVNYAYALNALGEIQMKSDKDLQAGLKTFRLSEKVLGDKAGDFLVVYSTIPYYSAWAYRMLHDEAGVNRELARYQAVIDGHHEPVNSAWRKKLANLRKGLAEAGKRDAG